MSGDPGSLAKLNDIVLAPAPSWWSPAPGWYVLLLVFVLLLIGAAYRLWRDYYNNRYRRAALLELAALEAEQGGQHCERLPELLKRTALHAYPREEIAMLSGESWRAFLDRHCTSRPFHSEAGELLDRLAYQPASQDAMNLQPLVEAIRTWIKQHRAEPC